MIFWLFALWPSAPVWAEATDPLAIDPPAVDAETIANEPTIFDNRELFPLIDPNRPGINDIVREMRLEIQNPSTLTVGLAVELATDLRDRMEGSRGVFFSFYREPLYAAAIVTGDCAWAHSLIWDEVSHRWPHVGFFRHDGTFDRLWRDEVLATCFPETLTCLLAREARTLDRYIADHGDIPVRPFTDHNSIVTAGATIYVRRDHNIWDLGRLATGNLFDEYPPAGVMLVELALELEGIALADDLLYMLLLHADANWPDDPDQPLPVERTRIAELKATLEPRLSEADLTRASERFAGREPERRLFLGDKDYFAIPADQRN